MPLNENLKVDVNFKGILNPSQKRGYKVYHMIARFCLFNCWNLCAKSYSVIFQMKYLFIRILQKEILEFFVEFIFIWPTVALLGVKE